MAALYITNRARVASWHSPACGRQALLAVRFDFLTIRRASSSCLPWVILRREVGAFASSRPNPACRRQGSLSLSFS